MFGLFLVFHFLGRKNIQSPNYTFKKGVLNDGLSNTFIHRAHYSDVLSLDCLVDSGVHVSLSYGNMALKQQSLIPMPLCGLFVAFCV